MRLTIVLIAALLALPTQAESAKTKEAKKKNAYGAIAWHRETGSIGYSYDHGTARMAAVEALRQCAHPDCEVNLALRNECGAIAEGSRAYAARRGFTGNEARAKALKACGAGCRPVAWACTR